jgi:hypothetical protein
MEKLAHQENDKKRKHLLGGSIAICCCVASIVLISILIWAAFWGVDAQRRTSLEILKILGTLIAGYGVINAIAVGIRKLLA